jgi:hypothetical protein
VKCNTRNWPLAVANTVKPYLHFSANYSRLPKGFLQQTHQAVEKFFIDPARKHPCNGALIYGFALAQARQTSTY